MSKGRREENAEKITKIIDFGPPSHPPELLNWAACEPESTMVMQEERQQRGRSKQASMQSQQASQPTSQQASKQSKEKTINQPIKQASKQSKQART